MNAHHLLRKQVVVMVSDPWDFVEECGEGPFYGHISDLDGQTMLVILDAPLECQNTIFLSAMCQLRHEGSSIADVGTKTKLPVPMNIILLSLQAETLDDVVAANFPGALTVIGGVLLAAP